MSFSSNIFTNLPLVHTLNPDFLGQQLWLCFSAGSWMSSHVIPELGPRQIPELAFASSSVRDSGLLHVRDPISSPNQDSRTSHIREFEASQVPRFRKSWIPCPWKTCFENFVKLNVSRVTGFPEFPNTSPSGKRVDSDDPIPRIRRKFSKKCHPRNVGGDTRRPGTLGRLDRGRFRGITPLRPYK
jgi:hypothetical protein